MTLTNGSGTPFKNTKLQLVAGDLNRVRQTLGRLEADEMRASKAAAPAMAQESFSDYHLYTLARKTTINNNETKQVSMLEGTGVPVQKRYVVSGQYFYYRNPMTPGAPMPIRSGVTISAARRSCASSLAPSCAPLRTTRTRRTSLG